MHPINFIVFPIVGAVIGAATNKIAIKMLFRPYKPWFIGKFKLPFTPGVIPQQRKVIAHNIAITFEKNLLSGDDIHKILSGEKVKEALEQKVDEFIAQFGAFASMLKGVKPKIMAKILEAIQEVGQQAIADGGELNIAEKIEEKINNMDVANLEELVLGFSKEQFGYITLFGGILGALIGIIQALLTGILPTG